MKSTNKFNRKTIYSDTDISSPFVTIFKYLCKNKGSNYFKCIGGVLDYYGNTNYDRSGPVVEFSVNCPLYQLSATEIQELIAKGIITESEL